MTEEEMKTKWCPHTILIVANEDGTYASLVNCNRMAVRDTGDFSIPHASKCLGSECSQWRWKKVANPKWQSQTNIMSYPQPNSYSQEPMGIDSTIDGYCGLAGNQ